MQHQNPYGENVQLRGAWVPNDLNIVEQGKVHILQVVGIVSFPETLKQR